MKKTYLILFTLIIMLVGCSDNSKVSSDVKNKSKEVGVILIDYMQNGKQIGESEQGKIDSYISKYGNNIKSYNEYEQVVIDTIVQMKSEVFYYNSYEKQDDKQKAMDRFNTYLSDYEKIFKKLA